MGPLELLLWPKHARSWGAECSLRFPHTSPTVKGREPQMEAPPKLFLQAWFSGILAGPPAPSLSNHRDHQRIPRPLRCPGAYAFMILRIWGRYWSCAPNSQKKKKKKKKNQGSGRSQRTFIAVIDRAKPLLHVGLLLGGRSSGSFLQENLDIACFS